MKASEYNYNIKNVLKLVESIKRLLQRQRDLLTDGDITGCYEVQKTISGLFDKLQKFDGIIVKNLLDHVDFLTVLKEINTLCETNKNLIVANLNSIRGKELRLKILKNILISKDKKIENMSKNINISI